MLKFRNPLYWCMDICVVILPMRGILFKKYIFLLMFGLVQLVKVVVLGLSQTEIDLRRYNTGFCQRIM